MARANRHHIPGQVWHITHRCHKKSASFVVGTKARLGAKAMGRKVEVLDDRFMLREETEPYNADFAPQKGLLNSTNSYYWNDYSANLMG